MTQPAAKDVRMCVECGTTTERWVHGWDGKYRCMDHASRGPRPDRLVAHHCPTCRCPVLPAAPSPDREGSDQ